MPEPKMSTPFTRSEMPMKNQIEMPPPRLISASPKDDIHDDECRPDNRCPEPRPMPRGDVTFRWNFRRAVDEAFQFRIGFGLRDKADDKGDQGASQAGPQGAIHVLCHVARVG